MIKQSLLITTFKDLLLFTCLLSIGSILVSAKPVLASQSHPRTIIALAPHSVELLFAIGAGDRIVATTEYADFPEAAKTIPRIGGYHGLNIEKIFALNPDLIVAWESGNRAQDLARLESLGLNVYRSNIETIDMIGGELRKLGEMLGISDIAEKVAGEYETELARVRDLNRNKKPVHFFYQLWLDPLKTMTSYSWVNETLRSCGGVNIFEGDGKIDYPQVSMEAVIEKAPTAIIIPSHHGDGFASGEKWAQWPEIPAVKNKAIFFIDGDLLHRSSLRITQGMHKVCEAFDAVRETTSLN